MSRRLAVRIERRTPPPPQPTPQHTAPAPAPNRRSVRVAVPKLSTSKERGAESAVRVAAATPTPPPPRSPSPGGCTVRSAEPAVTQTPDPPPVLDADTRRAGTNGTSQIRVALAPSGNVVDAQVVGSSGNPLLDRVALDVARRSTYTPGI
ncbi:MAG: TonB family protein, partial [Candidatus Eremiobacteraeota bacterium]|nr:TonB family protein [Candidatus Eremiobacteraeota bacterium]